MNLEDFKKSLADEMPPVDISLALQALWQAGKGNWDAAHALAQRNSDAASAWVHAYLHRKEGDNSNAAYWYARAGRSMPTLGFQDEWEAILGELLGAD
jgi:hypothetical protein